MPQIPFELFLLTGLLPYFVFKNIVFFLMDGADSNKNLFSYKPVKPIDVYISRTILEVVLYTVIFTSLMFLMGWFFDMPTTPSHFLGLFFSFLLLIIFGFSVGLGFALIVKSFKAFRIVVKNIFRVLYFTSGIMYPLWIIPKPYIDWLLFNPIVHLIEIFRESYFANYPHIDHIGYEYPFILTVVLLYIGLWFYYKKRFELSTVV